MWKFRSYPRCWGHTFLDRDRYGWYREYLNHGYRRDLKISTEAVEQLLVEKELPTGAREECVLEGIASSKPE